MGTIATLLADARVTRRRLNESPRYAGQTSIRDAVELAADGLRQAEDERRAEGSAKVCGAHGRPYAWPHAVGCTECCRLAAESADSNMAPNGGFWA